LPRHTKKSLVCMSVQGNASRLLRQIVQSFEYSDTEESLLACSSDELTRDDDEIVESRNVTTSIGVNDDDDDSISRRLAALPTNTCSVCSEEVDDYRDLFTLECGDVFCRSCLGSWAKAQSGDVTRVLHQIACVKPLSRGKGIAISYEWRTSLPCAGFECTCLIQESVLKLALDEASMAKLQKVATIRRAQLAAIEATIAERSNELLLNDKTDRLPRDARGAMQCPRCETYNVYAARRGRLRCMACLLPLCATCEGIHVRSETCEHKVIPARAADRQFARFLRTEDVRCCPKCGVIIQKNGGCDHMICARCSCDFQWPNARLTTTRIKSDIWHYSVK